MAAILVAVAIGVAVPVLLLIGPYVPYLLVRERRKLPPPEANRFAEGFAAGIRGGGGR